MTKTEKMELKLQKERKREEKRAIKAARRKETRELALSTGRNLATVAGMRILDNAQNHVMSVINRPYKSVAARATAILLMDLGLYAGFAVIAGAPLLLLGVSPVAVIAITAIAWLSMDAAACAVRSHRLRKAAGAASEEL